jgi:hypothetical protein
LNSYHQIQSRIIYFDHSLQHKRLSSPRGLCPSLTA